jgi:hypothetical protein
VLSSRLELTSKEGERSAPELHIRSSFQDVFLSILIFWSTWQTGLENIFPFLAANSNIKLPAYADFRECMMLHIVINFNLGTGQSRLAKYVCKHKVYYMARPRKYIAFPSC